MAMGRPKAELILSDEERTQLERWARRPKSSQRLALRARIVLACSDGSTNSHVAERLGIAKPTVGKWRQRFVEHRLEGLNDDPRPGPPRKISDEDVERVVTKTLESKPKNATHWSTRSMAKATGLSQNAVWRIWNAFGLQPHRTKTFKISEDPLFIEKVRDIVGLYMNPPDNALVFCVDEKSQVQALDRTQQPWQVERHTHDYVRHGTTSLFAALNTKTGEVIGRCHARHRQQEFLKFLKHVDASTEKSEDLEIHLVMDNYATHKTASVQRWLARRPEYVVHFTPTGASWLNQVERFFAEITNQRIRRGSFRSVPELRKAIMDYLDEHNQDPKPFIWTADADLILNRVAGVCIRINQSGH